MRYSDESLRKGDFLEIKASIQKRGAVNSLRIRMKWIIRNNSKEKIRILGYYCPFYRKKEQITNREGEFHGAYIPDRDKWIKEEFRTENDHVNMVLWPKERRDYVWAEVQPEYYGIRDEGYWYYRVRFYYQLQSTGEFLYQDSNEAGFNFRDTILESGEEKILRDFFLDSEGIVRALRKHDELIHPFPDWDSATDVTMAGKNRIDLLLQTRKHFIVVETKHIITPNSILQIERFIRRVQKIFGRQYGKETIGIIIGKEIRQSAIQKAGKSKNEIRLMRTEVVHNHIQLCPIDVQKGNSIF